MSGIMSSAIPADLAEIAYDGGYYGKPGPTDAEVNALYVQAAARATELVDGRNLVSTALEALECGTDREFWLLMSTHWHNDATVGKLFKKAVMRYAEKLAREELDL